MRTDFERPRWQRDLVRFLPLKPQFVLSGNVRDLQLAAAGDGVAALALSTTLADLFIEAGYAQVVGYDPVAGFRALRRPGADERAATGFLERLDLQPGHGGAAPAGPELFAATLERVVAFADEPVALVVDFASRLTVRKDAPTPQEHQLFTRAFVASHQARPRPHGTPRRPFFNTVVWILEREGDLPDWLTVGNPRIRGIPLPKPDHAARRSFASSLLRALPGFLTADEVEAREAVDALSGPTEGMLLVDLAAVSQLARTEGIGFAAIGDAVRRYKVGVEDDPWARLGRDRLVRGATRLRERVRGQERAVVHMLDVVKRATTGVGAPGRGGRPRGMAFLAGPTGVGKTELAKALTELLFGDEGAYVRFDMSEFSAEHADQRLIGAPPGYVGYDAGGELTNAVREKPFCLLLFDEIEKAHPRILDKFLQVLDEGVLTSGRGDRVYFSETFIVFTSNLGIYRSEADGARVANVTSAQPYAEIEEAVRSEITRHFKLVLNRPEILNRMGDNVVVFDFVRPEVAEEILSGMLDGVVRDLVKEKGLTLAFDAQAGVDLRRLCLSDLSNGGRGIRNKVETHVLNPLARAMFEFEPPRGSTMTVEALDVDGEGVTSLRLAPARGPANVREGAAA